jgi:tetratricopeptide (TPR) repeat protein
MREHPTAAELEGLVRGDLTREQARLVVRHLLRGCESCVAFIAPYASMLLDGSDRADRSDRSGYPEAAGVSALQVQTGSNAPLRQAAASSGRSPRRARSDGAAATSSPPEVSPISRPASKTPPAANVAVGAGAQSASAGPATPSGVRGSGDEPDRTLLENAYDRAIDRAFAAVMQHGEKAARASARVHETLSQLGADGLDSLRELPAGLRGYAAYEALLERSWAMRREDPKQMVKLAELAVMAAADLRGEGFSAGQVHDFQARAAIELANAYRVTERLEEADSGLQTARGSFRQGSQDRLLGARLLEVEATIHADRGELAVALSTLDLALRTYRRYGDPHLAARSLIKKGLYTFRIGRRRDAIELLTEGLEMIDPRQDGPLVLAAIHNTACCLVEDGRCREARSLLWRHLGLYEQHAGRQDRVMLRWLQAQIYAGLDDLGRSERAYEEVRRDLREVGRLHGEALATVELAAVRLRQGREDVGRGLALEGAQLFLGLDISSEAAASLEILMSRLEKSPTVAPEQVGRILQLLRDAAPGEQPSLLVQSA